MRLSQAFAQNGITVDDKVFRKKLDDLSSKEMRSSLRAGLKKGANVLVIEARKQLRTATPKSRSKNWWNGRAMQQGIKTSVGRDLDYVKVHILGDFRLKWFERGTKSRVIDKYRSGHIFYDRANKTKHPSSIKGSENRAAVPLGDNIRMVGKYRGKMRPRKFFTNARRNAESKIFDEIEDNVEKQIKKRLNK